MLSEDRMPDVKLIQHKIVTVLHIANLMQPLPNYKQAQTYILMKTGVRKRDLRAQPFECLLVLRAV